MLAVPERYVRELCRSGGAGAGAGMGIGKQVSKSEKTCLCTS